MHYVPARVSNHQGYTAMPVSKKKKKICSTLRCIIIVAQMEKCVAVVFLLFVCGRASLVRRVAEYSSEFIIKSNKVDDATEIPSSAQLRFSGGQWITQLFRQAEDVFHIDRAASEPCRRAYDMFKMYLRNQTVWAIRSK